jgi:hypothetical protein
MCMCVCRVKCVCHPSLSLLTLTAGCFTVRVVKGYFYDVFPGFPAAVSLDPLFRSRLHPPSPVSHPPLWELSMRNTCAVYSVADTHNNGCLICVVTPSTTFTFFLLSQYTISCPFIVVIQCIYTENALSASSIHKLKRIQGDLGGKGKMSSL